VIFVHQQYDDQIFALLSSIKNDMKELVKAQQVSNLLAVAKNSEIQEEVRWMATKKAMELLGLPLHMDVKPGISRY